VSTITTQDGTQIDYKDWGTGQPVVFSHGWPLSADAWEDQMLSLASRGYRCIATIGAVTADRVSPWPGNDMDTYADDLAALVGALDRKAAIHVGTPPAAAGGPLQRFDVPTLILHATTIRSCRSAPRRTCRRSSSRGRC
jgi:non-heme chloroperoxidase